MLKVTLVTLGDPGSLSGGYLYHRRIATAAPALDARLEFASFPAWPFPLPVLAARRLARQVLQGQPDAVVIDSIAAAYVSPALSRWPDGLPRLGVLHQPPGGIDHGPLRTELQRALDLAAYRRMDGFIVASQALAEDMRMRGFPSQQIWLVPPGCNPVPPGDPVADPRGGRALAVLCVANWQERKGVLDLLEALARLPEPMVTLHLAGDPCPGTPYGRRVRQRIAREDVRGRVVVHGALKQAQVAALYAAADVFCLPSLREPYGTVYGEAMAAGLPVVGYRVGNLPNLATHEREGLLVPPSDVAGLAEALRRLAGDEPTRLRLARAAKMAGEALPTWQDTAERFVACVRAAVGRSRP